MPVLVLSVADNNVVVERTSTKKPQLPCLVPPALWFKTWLLASAKATPKSLKSSVLVIVLQFKGKTLGLNIGFCHTVDIDAPEGIEFKCPDQTHIEVSGIDKQAVGQIAAEIRAVRKPEPYKGKGIRYEGEQVRRKEGKSGK